MSTGRPKLERYHGDLIDLRSGNPLRAANKREADYCARMLEENGPPGTFLLDGAAVFVRPPAAALDVAAPSSGRARPLPLPDDFTVRLEVAAGPRGPGPDRQLGAKRGPVRVILLAPDSGDDPNRRNVVLAIKNKRQWVEVETSLRLLPNGRAQLERDAPQLEPEGFDILDAEITTAIAEARQLHAQACARRRR